MAVKEAAESRALPAEAADQAVRQLEEIVEKINKAVQASEFRI